MNKFVPQKLFQKLEKTNDNVIISGLSLGLRRVGVDYSPENDCQQQL